MLKQNLKKFITFFFQGPVLLRLNPTGVACNYKCLMCENHLAEAVYLNIDKHNLLIDHYVSLLKDLPLSIRTIEVVGGGEPLMYKNIDVLLKAIKQKRIKGSLITNGSLLSSELSQTLVNCSWDTIRISLNAATNDTFKKVNGCDCFHTVMNNIKSLIKSRKNRRLPKVSFHFVIQKFNYFELIEYFELAHSLGVDKAMLDTLIVSDSNKYLLLSDAENKEVLHLLAKAEEIAQVDNNIEKIIKIIKSNMYTPENISRREYLKDKYCDLVQTQLEIRSNGIVVPCCMAHELAGTSTSIKQKNIKLIWKESESFRKDLSQGRFYSFCINRCNYEMPVRK
jgi:MoaA/NifB/PqqE/SkfB family radical SAM enzyme